VQVPLLIAQARRSGTVRYVWRRANVWSNVLDGVLKEVDGRSFEAPSQEA